MRLYHLQFFTNARLFLACVIFSCMTGCIAPQSNPNSLKVILKADGSSQEISVNQGSTVEQLLTTSGVKLSSLDRVEPTSDKLLTDGMIVSIIRVKEEFTVEQSVIPFTRQLLQTESLPAEQTLLAQKGENGIEETNYRITIEDGKQVSRQQVGTIKVIKEAVPEIVMVGIQSLFTPVPIPGRIVYLVGGNAWKMEQNTGNRRPLITTGDIDGRIFSLSPDGSWLLFTRKSKQEGQINELWAAKIDGELADIKPIDLKVANVVHFGDWIPGAKDLRITFSTVEPRTAAPGWQANNDLVMLSFSNNGWISKPKTLLDANSGGIYGWWGTNFKWSPGGDSLAFARPDSVGIVDVEKGLLTPLVNVTPLQTRGDWGWVPSINWGPDGDNIYSIDHVAQTGVASPEESQSFSLTAISLIQGAPIHLVANTGMFSYPVASPFWNTPAGNTDYQISFLQAIFPIQSETSRYRLFIMDRDGSNKHSLFPAEAEPGLEPQEPVWSPTAVDEKGNYTIAVIYQGNLWLVDIALGQSTVLKTNQVTGDGLVKLVEWGPLK